MFASSLVALFAALGVNAAIGPVTDLPIVNKVIAPDGFNRSTVLAGGTFPGPLITGNKGNQLKINVQDRLTDGSMRKSTSIHWHGFFQKGSNWADGGVGVNQCPIAPGNDFEYKFSSANQAGTFWYHSHLSTQYCDGLRGAMVIYDPLDINKLLYDVDNEDTVITLADWYHTVAPQQPLPATPESTLINGKGRYIGGPLAPLSVINVTKGKRYRFRIVSLSCDPTYQFSIEGHDMTIIAIDSINVIPKTVDQIQVFAGQRYDVVVNANKNVGNYHVRALPNFLAGGSPNFSNGMNSAILRYQGAPDAEPTFSAGTATKALVEKDLKPQNILTWPAPGLPKVDGADVNINLNLGFDFSTFLFTINGKSFVPPTVPVLLQILSGKQKAQDLLPEGLVIPLPPNKSIQLSLPAAAVGGIGGPHPFHLHGHAFHVVRAAGQSDYNWLNPPQRDVVSTGVAGDNVTIRFRTDNPGPWFLHCHIDWHLETGFALVFAEDTAGTQKQDPPPAWDALCPTYDALDPSDQ